MLDVTSTSASVKCQRVSTGSGFLVFRKPGKEIQYKYNYNFVVPESTLQEVRVRVSTFFGFLSVATVGQKSRNEHY